MIQCFMTLNYQICSLKICSTLLITNTALSMPQTIKGPCKRRFGAMEMTGSYLIKLRDFTISTQVKTA